MTPWRTISVALQASTAGYVTSMGQAGAATKAFGTQAQAGMAKADAAAKKTQTTWQKFSKVAMFGLAGLAIGIGLSIKEAVSWESAWAGVVKTVEGTDAQLSSLSDSLLDMARNLPASREEIAGVAEAAGQLGIRTDDISEFTRVMIDMGVATDLTSEEAATSIAKLMNVMQTAPEDVGRLGAAIVDLGNKGASTEGEILALAQRIAGAGALVGATEADVLALSNALASMGIPAELGGGAIQRVFLKIVAAASEGGEKLDAFADAAGMSAGEFKRAWEAAPIETFDQVVKGLRKVKDEGGDLIGMLSDMKIKGTQERQVLLRMVGASDLLSESLENGRTAWEEGTALTDEATKRYETAASQMKIFGNKVSDVARIVGAALIPMLLGALSAAEGFGAWVQSVGLSAAEKLGGAFNNLKGAGADLVTVVGAVLDVVRPVVELLGKIGGAAVLAAVSLLASGLGNVLGLLADNEAAVKAVVAAMIAVRAPAALSMIVGTLNLVIMRWVALGAAIKAGAVIQGLKTVAAGFATMQVSAMAGIAQVRVGLATLATSAVLAGAAITGAAYLGFKAWEKWGEEGTKMGTAYAKGVTKGLSAKNLEGFDRMRAQLDSVVRHSRAAADSSSAPWDADYRQTMRKAADAAEAESDRIYEAYVPLMNAATDLGMTTDQVLKWVAALDLPDEVTSDSFLLAKAIREGYGAAVSGTPKMNDYADAVEVLADETSNLGESTDAWVKSMKSALGMTKDVKDAQLDWYEGMAKLSEGLKENEKGFDLSTEAGRENAAMVSDGVDLVTDLAAAFALTYGPEAGATALVAYREELIKTMTQSGYSKTAAEEYVNSLGLTPDLIETEVRLLDVDKAKEEADAYQKSLLDIPKFVETTIRTVQESAGRPVFPAGRAQLPGNGLGSGGNWWENRHGGVYSFATGGITPAHVGYGTQYKWAEPETGGEAFIPRKGNKARSLSILNQAASWYGMTVAPPRMGGASAGASGGNRNFHGGITNNVTMRQAKVTPRMIEKALLGAIG